MKLIILLLFCTIFVNLNASKCTKSEDTCDTTDYKAYVDCIRRSKRSIDCDSSCEDGENCGSSCDDCDCNSCSDSCGGSCQSSSCCSSCCNNNYRSCTTNHCCHKTCHAKCRSSSCRSSCRKTCYDSVKEEKVRSETIRSDSKSETNNEAHNITTIIHLNNIINNTNLIDVPITLNNTNINNITITNPEPSYSGGANTLNVLREYEKVIKDSSSSTASSNNSCCLVISPRQCVSQEKFPFVRCFHYRSQQCGPYCNSPIVHVEPRQVCDSVPNQEPTCHQQLIYIPQPQPKCVYQSYWPYVSCGPQQQQQQTQQQSCGGCYSHYVDQSSKSYQSCSSSCYDEGFGGTAPYYRQGPFFRPNYSHQPPCYQYGTCNQQVPSFGGNIGGGFGGFVDYGGFSGYGQNFQQQLSPVGGINPELLQYAEIDPSIKNLIYGVNGSNVQIHEPLQPQNLFNNLYQQTFFDPNAQGTVKVQREIRTETEEKQDATGQNVLNESNKLDFENTYD